MARHVRTHSPNSNETDVHAALESSSKKWIMRFFFAHRSHGAVTRANNCVVRKRQDFFEIILQRVIVGNVSAAHRSRKERIAYYRDLVRLTHHNVRQPTT